MLPRARASAHESLQTHQSFSARRGVTLVEVLVVIAILAVLMSFLFPALQSARESARLTQCMNHVKQLAVAVQQHELSMRVIPAYAGEAISGRLQFPPGRGRDARFAGPNWIMECLRRAEHQALADALIAACLPTPDAATDAVASVVQQPVPFLICPSRRTAKAYPLHSPFKERFGDFGAKTDYAMNGGAGEPAVDDGSETVKQDGVWILGAQTSVAGIRDGLSKTYLIGEKSIDAAAIDNGGCFGDRSPIVGFPDDGGAINSMVRFALRTPERDRIGNCRVCHDFGSAHLAGWNVAMCDGSVRTEAFDIDLTVHRQQASSRGRD